MQWNQETSNSELSSFFSHKKPLEWFGTSWTWAWFQSQKLKPCNFAIQKSKHLQQPIQQPETANPTTWNITTFLTETRNAPQKNRTSMGIHQFFSTMLTFPGSKYGDQTSVEEAHHPYVHALPYPVVFLAWWGNTPGRERRPISSRMVKSQWNALRQGRCRCWLILR